MKRTPEQAKERIEELEEALRMVQKKADFLAGELSARIANVKEYCEVMLDEKRCRAVRKQRAEFKKWSKAQKAQKKPLKGGT